VLPEFPPFTHAEPKLAGQGIKPWASVNEVLGNIPYGTPNHDLAAVEAHPLNNRPWSGDSIAPRCITTHGGHNYHPSGKRHFTNREFASLQGFPLNHKFSEVNVKKQIGNAVPPMIAKVLFKWIKKTLENADGVQSEGVQGEIIEHEVIVLD
jgi:DNA (cytosine-5)-methyltransferase 1